MLGQYLESSRREVVAEISSYVTSVDATGLFGRERSARLDGLVGELITALRHGGVADTQGPEPTVREAETETREREVVQRDVIHHITRKHVDATLDEIAIVADWAGASERRRLRTECHRLCALLDAVDEIATVYASDGRLQYVNRRAAERIHETSGVPADAIIGKTATELGLPHELGGCSCDELLSMAREESHRGQPLGTLEGGKIQRDLRTRRKGLGRDARGARHPRPEARRDSAPHPVEARHARRQRGLRRRPGGCRARAHSRPRRLVYGEPRRGEQIRSTFVAQRNPGKAALRDALMAAVRGWNRHPLWEHLLTSGFQLLHDVSDDMQRKLVLDDEHYQMLHQVGIRSLLVVPIVSVGRAVGIITFAYTAESGRRYDRDDPELAQEMALHAALILENARLLKELRASEARFHFCLEGARTIVFEQDAALRYRRIYSPFVPCPIVGKTDAEILLPEDAAQLTTLKRRALDRGEHVHDELWLNLSGNKRFFRETVEPMLDHAGRAVGVMGSAVDVTDEKLMQQQLAEALAYRDRMMGVLGHDLRSPLSAITAASAALLRRKDLPEDIRNKALVLERASARMSEMINTLLDMTHVSVSGTLPVAPRGADLGDIARSVVDEARVANPESAIELDLRGDLHGRWDPARMAQALSNLVTNGLVYGDPGKPLRVSASEQGADEVRVMVTNEGPPIPPAQLPGLFDPFTRGTSERSPSGLGLGLYIVKQIAVAHHGTIAVESSVQAGTVFTVYLPREKTSPGSKKP